MEDHQKLSVTQVATKWSKIPRGIGRARGRLNPAYRRRLRPRVAQEPADVQPPEPQQLMPNPPLQLQPLIPMHEPKINQHPLSPQPLQVLLGEIDHVELLDEPLLVPADHEYDIFISIGTKEKKLKVWLHWSGFVT